jgi:hypothetical protein
MKRSITRKHTRLKATPRAISEVARRRQEDAMTTYVHAVIAATLKVYAAPIAQASADAVVAELAAKGLLRSAPRMITTVDRDEAGNIVAMITTEEPA